jgi:hypothetical protein
MVNLRATVKSIFTGPSTLPTQPGQSTPPPPTAAAAPLPSSGGASGSRARDQSAKNIRIRQWREAALSSLQGAHPQPAAAESDHSSGNLGPLPHPRVLPEHVESELREAAAVVTQGLGSKTELQNQFFQDISDGHVHDAPATVSAEELQNALQKKSSHPSAQTPQARQGLSNYPVSVYSSDSDHTMPADRERALQKSLQTNQHFIDALQRFGLPPFAPVGLGTRPAPTHSQHASTEAGTQFHGTDSAWNPSSAPSISHLEDLRTVPQLASTKAAKAQFQAAMQFAVSKYQALQHTDSKAAKQQTALSLEAYVHQAMKASFPETPPKISFYDGTPGTRLTPDTAFVSLKNPAQTQFFKLPPGSQAIVLNLGQARLSAIPKGTEKENAPDLAVMGIAHSQIRDFSGLGRISEKCIVFASENQRAFIQNLLRQPGYQGPRDIRYIP